MGTTLLLAPLLAPLAAGALAAVLPWCRVVAATGVVAALVILASAIGLAAVAGSPAAGARVGWLHADALAVFMLLVIGVVATLATLAGIGYVQAELAAGHTTPGSVRWYGVLVQVFIAAMVTAVESRNLGITWVAIEATTVATAFLVGHRRTRAAMEATWKYVLICSVGIALALLGTVFLYLAALHAGATTTQALDLGWLTTHAGALDPGVTRMAMGLLLLGYGTKAGLVPFHTWLADAHSQAPAPVSALMSGVLLAVAFSILARIRVIADGAVGPGFLRVGLLVVGLLTLVVAAGLLVVQRDYKRMLAYSTMENMGLLALAAAAGTPLATTALLLHILGHGIGKSVLFLSSGQVQQAHGSTAIADVSAILTRRPLLGAVLAAGLAALIGLPPFSLFASELGIVRGLAERGLVLPLGIGLLLVLIAAAALVRHGIGLLLGSPQPDQPRIALPATVAIPLVVGVVLLVALGISVAPLQTLLTHAGAILAGPR